MKLIALDMFATLLNLAQTPREEVRAYLAQCVDPVWKPLELPSSWERLKVFPDVKEGVERLRKKFLVVTLSNAPFKLTNRVLEANDVWLTGITPLERIQRYKPHPECYSHACDVWGVKPSEAMMVTANPTFGMYHFGDLEIAGAIGMKTQLIRQPGCPQTLLELAEQLGC